MRLGPFGGRGDEREDSWEGMSEEELSEAFEDDDGIPAAFAWMRDEAFCWVAAGELLTALGVRPETVRPLGELRPLIAELKARDERTNPAERPDSGAELDPAERARVHDMIDRAAPVLLPLAREVLERLRALRIRTELVGLDADAIARLVDRLEETYREGAWRTMGDEELQTLIADRLAEDPTVEPATPGPAELGRIVGVLRGMPRPTLERITKVTSAPALMALVGGGLAMLRSGSTGLSSTDQSSTGDSRIDPLKELHGSLPPGWTARRSEKEDGRFLVERRGPGADPLPVVRVVRNGIETDLAPLTALEREELARAVEREIHGGTARPGFVDPADLPRRLRWERITAAIGTVLAIGAGLRLIAVAAPEIHLLPDGLVGAVLTPWAFPGVPLLLLAVALVRSACAALPRPDTRRGPGSGIVGLLLLAVGTLAVGLGEGAPLWWGTFLLAEDPTLLLRAITVIGCFVLAVLLHVIGVVIGRRADRAGDSEERGEGRPGRGKGPSDQPSVNGAAAD